MLISLGFYIGFEIKVKIDNKKMAKLENKLEEEKRFQLFFVAIKKYLKVFIYVQ